MGSEKRLGGRMALFVRTGLVLSGASQHVIAGSVHKVEPKAHREEIWRYLGFGSFPNATGGALPRAGIAPQNVLGIVTAGDMESRSFCTEAGISNLDRPQRHKTFPVDCTKGRLGLFRGDQFCGNMKIDREDRSILPCYVSREEKGKADATGLQISDHAIIEIMLKTSLT